MSSCSSQAQAVASEPLPIITVDGVAINEVDLANELQYHQHPDFAVVVQQAGQALVIKQLLLKEASDKNIEAENEEAVLQKLLEKSVSYDDPDELTCQRYFQNNPEKFTTMPLMEVDHILLAAAKDDISGRDEAETLAKQLINQLKENNDLFASLAEQYSICPSKKMGGNLGQISKGQTVPEFERQLMTLPQGLAAKPIQSRYGFHVVRINRKIEGKPLEYNMVADKVRGYLVHRASHLAIQAFIQGLVEKAKIEGVKIKFAEENIYV